MITALTGLYQLKHGNVLDIRFDYTEEDWMDEVEIPPAVFLTLYENALKHSAIGNNSEAWIRVSITIEGDKLHFVVWNSISGSGEVNVHYEYKGIGLTLIRQLMILKLDLVIIPCKLMRRGSLSGGTYVKIVMRLKTVCVDDELPSLKLMKEYCEMVPGIELIKHVFEFKGSDCIFRED